MSDQLKIEIKVEKAQERFNKISERAQNTHGIMQQVSGRMWKDVIENFKQEKNDDGQRWKKWSKWEKGKKTLVGTRPYGLGGNKLLQDTGTLRSSINFKADKNDAIVFSRNKYAALHNYGGPFKAWGKHQAYMPRRMFMWIPRDKVQEYVKMIQIFVVGK